MASKNHFRVDSVGRGRIRCLGCKRPAIYGDRCHECRRELRQRRRRKPR